MSSCQHDCDKTPVFPEDIINRPGLARLILPDRDLFPDARAYARSVE